MPALAAAYGIGERGCGRCPATDDIVMMLPVRRSFMPPNDSRALASLDPQEGRTMGSLADEWECDASNATWIVDRLERFGLAERRSVSHDRRITLVVLMARGVKTKGELIEELLTPPAELFDMAHGDLEALRRALEKFPRPTRRSALVASMKTKRR
jgi:DNA-binding MarR family transcriptional regulator